MPLRFSALCMFDSALNSASKLSLNSIVDSTMDLFFEVQNGSESSTVGDWLPERLLEYFSHEWVVIAPFSVLVATAPSIKDHTRPRRGRGQILHSSERPNFLFARSPHPGRVERQLLSWSRGRHERNSGGAAARFW